ncbi:MAG: hypothetical protein AABY54_09500 [Deltaproteobacteria bacterium]
MLGLFKDIERLIDGKLTIGNPPSGNELDAVVRLIDGKTDTVTEAELKRLISVERLDAVKSDIGLKLTGSYINNMKNGILDDERSSFNNSAYLGVEWELLREGYLQRKREKDRFQGDVRLNELLSQRSGRDEALQRLYYKTIYIFNIAKMRKLRERLDYLDKYINTARQLYHYKLFAWEEIVKLEQERVTAGNILKNYLSFEKVFSNQQDLKFPDAEKELPVLDISIVTLINEVRKDDFYNRVLEAEMGRKVRIDDPLLDINFRIFARYYMDNLLSNNGQDSLAAGFYFKIPLSFSGKSYEKLGTLEGKLADLSLGRKQDGEIYQILDTYYEYQYKLNDYLKLTYRRGLIEERLRREGVKRSFGDHLYSPVHQMQLLDELYAVEFEILEVKQQLYLKLLELYRLTAGEDILKHVRVVKKGMEIKRYKGERSAYIWSEGFNEIDNDFLTMYIEQQEISDIIISVGERTNVGKLSSFIERIRSKGTKVQALIGSNELLRLNNRDRLAERIGNASLTGFDGVHLDIEPHTLPEWKERREELLKEYLDMLKFVREITTEKKIALAASIPVFYPENALKEMAEVIDMAYIMAYEIKDVQVFKNRVKEEIEIFKDKATLALRTKDFSTRLELEEFLGKVIDTTGIPRVAVHDIKGMVILDEKSAIDTVNLPR